MTDWNDSVVCVRKLRCQVWFLFLFYFWGSFSLCSSDCSGRCRLIRALGFIGHWGAVRRLGNQPSFTDWWNYMYLGPTGLPCNPWSSGSPEWCPKGNCAFVKVGLPAQPASCRLCAVPSFSKNIPAFPYHTALFLPFRVILRTWWQTLMRNMMSI